MLDSFVNKFNKDYNIERSNDNSKIIVFSKDKYSKYEISSCFAPYKNQDCIRKIYKNLSNMPRERFFYLEKINNKSVTKRDGILTYVMLNPSYASFEQSDSTMNRARNYAGKLYKICNGEKIGYKYFSVINIYSYRHHLSNVMKTILQNPNKYKFSKDNNITFIKQVVEQLNLRDFILAFGDSADKSDIASVIRLLKKGKFKTYFSELSKSGNPFHLLARRSNCCSKNDSIEFNSLTTVNFN